MLLCDVNIPISRLQGVGEKTLECLARLKLTTVGELLMFWPRYWENRSEENVLSEWKQKNKLSVYLTIEAHDYFGYGTMKTLKLIARDKNGNRCELLCFNRPFLKNTFPPGSKAFVYGSFINKFSTLQSSSFEIEKEEKAKLSILPIYHLTQGLTQSKLRTLISTAFKQYGKGITSSIPQHIAQEHNVLDKSTVLQYMHFPKSLDEVSLATHSIIFEEFYDYQYRLGKRSLEKRGRLPLIQENTNTTCEEAELDTSKIESDFKASLTPLQKALLERLPFSLTKDQKKAILVHNNDLKSNTVISSLIQGDVGSGKTITAFFIALSVIEAGGQVAFLAPTELLAKQHAENAAKLLEPLGARLAFLTGNVGTSGRKQLLSRLSQGELDMVIGTHALFSKDVHYSNLRLAIIDEQHRFGVLQRQAIIQKGKNGTPHVIMMSATPIPRSLTLSLFGDLDICIIKTKPIGRKEVITYVSKRTKILEIYNFVKKEIENGRQAYVVSPLIEENNTSQRSASIIFDELRQNFPKLRLALIHSKIAPEVQEDIMLDFKLGNIDILVSTTIIEVGVDVPNATCMVIEQAERFGLAALHQLRGRVGRGKEQSYCFLVYGSDDARELTEQSVARLKVLRDSTDGFEIAEKDLELRGPGDILGVRQSGYDFGFTLADPARDFEILQAAMKAAFSELGGS